MEGAYIGKIERGQHLPLLLIVLHVAGVLDCRPDQLFDRMEELLREQASEGAG